MVRVLLIILLNFFFFLNALSCSCSVEWNDSFSKTIESSKLVALVKVISLDDYFEYLDGSKIPYSMTVEIIKKYKGDEQRKKITILGDNGILCRPYLSDFKINDYYLVSPNPLKKSPNTQYDFFVCRTEYLKVDIYSKLAYGKYTMTQNKVTLSNFEKNLDNSVSNIVLTGLGFTISIAILALVYYKRKKVSKKPSK